MTEEAPPKWLEYLLEFIVFMLVDLPRILLTVTIVVLVAYVVIKVFLLIASASL